MFDYRPLDISNSCNSGLEALGDVEPIPNGVIEFHGLPFLMQERVISLNESDGNLNIPVRRKARKVIFAHSLGTAELGDVEPIGQIIANYIFHMSQNEDLKVPIRGRFEIASLPGADSSIKRGSSGIPALPFTAVTDNKNYLMDRYIGRWEETGRRQQESVLGHARWNYLWCWDNPKPEIEIDSIEVVPCGQQLIICAVTLSDNDEYPFARQAKRPYRIDLKDQVDSEGGFDLKVDVDRGVATYPEALSADNSDHFLNDPLKGWGEASNLKSTPAYVELSAIPSATISVSNDDVHVGTATVGEIETKGTVDTPRMRIKLLDPGKNWVKVRILDEDTNRPVPARVHFRSPEGVPYQPHGHHPHLNTNMGTWHIDVGGDVKLGQITYAVTDGTCEGWLPRGDVVVDIARGFEYDPLRAIVTIKPGQQQLDLRIKRWINMNSERWFSGDSHVHFLSTQGSHTESQAEDLNVVNLLQSQWGSLFTNKEEFIGEPSVSREGNNIVYVSQENRQHFMGHMILWGLKRPVMPWCTDGPSEAELGGSMETTLSHWADEAHDQGGYVISPHFPMPNGEPAALIATNRLDGVEMLRQTSINHNHYYRYLNCGYKLPLVGGTDKMDGAVPVGSYRTYVNIPDSEDFDYDNWCKNVARGRTFLSGGPIIHFSVEGHEIGDTLSISNPGTVEVEAWVESIFPVYQLEIVQEGKVVAATHDKNGTRRLEIRDKIKIDGNTWLAARSGGPQYYDSMQHHDIWNRGIFAHTSPIYVACKDDWWMYDEDVAQYMLTMIEGDLAYIRENSYQQKHSNVTHHHGHIDHVSYLEQPFLQAQEAVLGRLRNRR